MNGACRRNEGGMKEEWMRNVEEMSEECRRNEGQLK